MDVKIMTLMDVKIMTEKMIQVQVLSVWNFTLT